VLATIALLVAAFLPRIALAPRRSARLGCTSHLKQVGLAHRMFANDHNDEFPFAVSNELGGSLSFAHTPQVFQHYMAMSNELVTPKVLVCSEDKQRTRATSFLAPLSNQNISYFVGLDARESKPDRILSGDRNITGGTLSNGFLRLISKRDSAGWTRDIHNRNGNVGLADGSAWQVTPALLDRQIRTQDLAVIRLAIP